MKKSMPWYSDIYFPCCDRIADIDAHVEWLSSGKLPEKYAKALKKFYNTDDAKEIMNKMFFNKNKVLLYCDKCNKVWIVDLNKEKAIKKIAKEHSMNIKEELIKIAKLLKVDPNKIKMNFQCCVETDGEYTNEKLYTDEDGDVYHVEFFVKKIDYEKVVDVILDAFKIKRTNLPLVKEVKELIKKYNFDNKNNYNVITEYGYYGEESGRVFFNKEKEFKNDLVNLLKTFKGK